MSVIFVNKDVKCNTFENYFIYNNIMTIKNNPKKFLKKGKGKLASHNHGKTEFSKKRQQKIIEEQLLREDNFNKNNKK